MVTDSAGSLDPGTRGAGNVENVDSWWEPVLCHFGEVWLIFGDVMS